MPHLFVDISAHGFGHLAQTAPLLNHLHQMHPALRLTIRSGLPGDRLRQRITAPFEFSPGEPDFGFVMSNALEINLAATAVRYQQRHQDWPQAVTAEADLLLKLKPDLVLSNVAYLPLAGAARLGIPAVAICCLNWADLFRHYFGQEPWAATIHQQMLDAYRSAAAFLRVSPGMPMTALENLRTIAPIATVVPTQRSELAKALGISSSERWVLVGFGGIEHTLPVETWPRQAGLRWLVPDTWKIQRPDVSGYGEQFRFVDLLANADALITKTGYGSFVEAACNGIPVLYMKRQDWPEEPYLIEWLRNHTRAEEVTPDEANTGRFVTRLERLWQAPMPQLPDPRGTAEAAAYLSDLLRVA